MNIVFATNNLNKLDEIRSLLPSHFEVLSLKDIGCFEELPETNTTLRANALQKAKYIYDKYNVNCFADDTGLEIEALGGDPGVYSARYAGKDCNSENNIKKVFLNLKNNKNRNAQFITIIALIINGKKYLFEGKCLGTITFEKRGDFGFGYDPIFLPINHDITFAEMNKKEKGLISHRGMAVKKLLNFLQINF